jgi:hypothetical protein
MASSSVAASSSNDASPYTDERDLTHDHVRSIFLTRDVGRRDAPGGPRASSNAKRCVSISVADRASTATGVGLGLELVDAILDGGGRGPSGLDKDESRGRCACRCGGGRDALLILLGVHYRSMQVRLMGKKDDEGEGGEVRGERMAARDDTTATSDKKVGGGSRPQEIFSTWGLKKEVNAGGG